MSTSDLRKAFCSTFIDKCLSANLTATRHLYPSFNKLFQPKGIYKHMLNWSKDFPDIDMPERFMQGYLKVRDVVINELWGESQFRIIHRAYILFTKIDSDLSSLCCPKRGSSCPSLAQKLWTYPSIEKFWHQILAHINHVCNMPVAQDTMLFHLLHSAEWALH